MQELKIVGFCKFVSKKNGKEYFHIYCTYEQNNVFGFCTEEIYILPELVTGGDVALGKMCMPIYNKNGYIQELLLKE